MNDKETKDLKDFGLPIVRAYYQFDPIDGYTLQAEFERSLTPDEHRIFDDYISSTTYKEKRAREYPPLSDFADAYYWQQKGNDQPMADYIKKIDQIKEKYPKK